MASPAPSDAPDKENLYLPLAAIFAFFISLGLPMGSLDRQKTMGNFLAN